MGSMAHTAGTTGGLRSDLIDLSGVSLDELREVAGLPAALATLRSGLSDVATPLCESGMAGLCGSGQWLSSGARPVTVDHV